MNIGGAVESSPSVSGNYAYVGVSVYQGNNLQRVTIEPFQAAGGWHLIEESRATASIAYDYIYNGVDTGHVFYKLHDPFTDDYNELTEFIPDPLNYFVGSAAHTSGGIVYTGNDNGHFYALDAHDLTELVQGGYYDTSLPDLNYVCSSPAISYNLDTAHNRWVFVTTRSDGGKLYAFKTVK